MAYYFSRILPVGLDEAVRRVTEALRQEGFGISADASRGQILVLPSSPSCLGTCGAAWLRRLVEISQSSQRKELLQFQQGSSAPGDSTMKNQAGASHSLWLIVLFAVLAMALIMMLSRPAAQEPSAGSVESTATAAPAHN
jgi:hypothetical protein